MHTLYRIALSIKKLKLRAFSLIEIGISLSIIGLFLTFLFPIWNLFNAANKKQINEEKGDYIRYALQAFVIRNGVLPYAADTNGIEIGNKETEVPKTRGILPYKTLGISKEYAYDAYGNFFTYAMNKKLGKKHGIMHLPLSAPINLRIPQDMSSPNAPLHNTSSFCRLFEIKSELNSGKTIDVFINDSMCKENEMELSDEGESVFDPKTKDFYIFKPLRDDAEPLTSETFHKDIEYCINDKNNIHKTKQNLKCCNAVAWIIISHGPKGEGSFNKPYNGKNECKRKNSTSQDKFCFSPDPGDSGSFNDTVFWQSRFDLAAQAGFPCTSQPMDARD